MSDTNLYQVLGVQRSASADEIKLAYRELVKRYHPDLFATADEKAKATDKLWQINEAYSVLGNTESRRQYDQRFIQQQQPKARPRAPTARRARGTSRRRRHVDMRTVAAKILNRRPRFSKKGLGYTLAGAMVVLGFIYASRSEPRLATAWALMEKVEVSSAKGPSDGAGKGWLRLGQYASVSECAGILTQRVRKDEQEGSRAVFDEQKGTMAITVFIKTAEPERIAAGGAAKDAQQNERAEAEEGIESISKNVTKRVRTLECRITQRWETDSWLQATLRRMGLL